MPANTVSEEPSGDSLRTKLFVAGGSLREEIKRLPSGANARPVGFPSPVSSGARAGPLKATSPFPATETMVSWNRSGVGAMLALAVAVAGDAMRVAVDVLEWRDGVRLLLPRVLADVVVGSALLESLLLGVLLGVPDDDGVCEGVLEDERVCEGVPDDERV